ncbi:MAG: redoxin protein [Rhizobium sp.]|nr:redoxin protein [Rhizobium sp.]
MGAEKAVLDSIDGGIAYRFSARDLHLVLGPGADGSPVRVRVTIDGKAPGKDHGADTDPDGFANCFANRFGEQFPTDTPSVTIYEKTKKAGAKRRPIQCIA